MKRKCILIFLIVLAMGMTACSSESKENTVSVETDSPQETDQKKNTDTKDEETETNLVEPSKPKIAEEDEKASPEDEEITEGDPTAGIHFCCLVFYLVPDCGKGISETGYYLMHTGENNGVQTANE